MLKTTEAVLQAGLLPAQERRKGHFAKVAGRQGHFWVAGRLKEFRPTPCVRLRCANRTYGGLYLHRYARRETA